MPHEIKNLIDRFNENQESYSASTYNEMQLRQEFLNPFFEALGWDVSNKQGYAEAYKEVIHEDAIKIGTATKAPDYSFRVGGIRKFFVEAKKPFVNIKDDISSSFQLRRYAWSGKLPLSILTNFEEFAVYDCRIKPNKNDKASVGRILLIRYEEYEKRWDEIASIFSKEAILKGSFDKYAENAKGKKGTSEVDNEFLCEIERWRDMLARNIAIKNPELSQRELNFAVQRTIDRLIFLRICEDRGIEHYGTLMALLNGENVYKRIRQNFQKADEIYNSGLFHFRDEKGRAEPPDTLTLSLQIDDKPLKDIIANLYYPESPYEFSVLPADILGQVYEQFLGKVIRLTAGHQAKVEDKPEVKKAGGVFYTPTYIVDYIVKNTVGKLIEDKTPKQIEKIKILDPACGSGSFLIQAYQYLLDYHRDWYIKDGIEKNSKAKEPKLTRVRNGEWRLSTSERKKILLNNIHGVDIDSQAVEVTKLSMLLKVLEGENEQSLAQQMTLWHERALPDLENNIKCGNSLIGTDFFNADINNGVQETMALYGDYKAEEKIKINAFDWDGKNGFPAIMKSGGFDTVIGNPPYVRSQFIEESHKAYFSKNYEAASYQPDTFAFFIERGVKLLGNNGRLGFIIPNGILTNTYYSKLREYLLNNTSIEIIVDLKSNVFANASVDTSIFILSHNLNKTHMVKIGEWPSRFYNYVRTPEKSIRQSDLLKMPDFCFNTNIEKDGFKTTLKIRNKSVPLSEFFKVKAGMKVRKEYVGNNRKDKRYNKFLLGNSIKPYFVTWDKKYVCYDKTLESTFTNQAFRDEDIFLCGEKIFVRQVMGKERIYATIDRDKYYVDQTVYVLIPENAIRLEYFLGLICSKLISYYFSNTISDRKQTFPKIKGIQIEQLPIRRINFSILSEKTLHDKMVNYVTSMLDLHKNIPLAKTDHEKTIIQRQIDGTDRRIDELVYELYGLTEEEIKIVEGSKDKKE